MRCLSANPSHRSSLRQLLAVFEGQGGETSVEHQLSARSQLSLTSTVMEEEQTMLRMGERGSSTDRQFYARVRKQNRRGRRSQTQPVNIGVDQIMRETLEDKPVQPATMKDTASVERHKLPVVPPPSGLGTCTSQLSLHSLVEPGDRSQPQGTAAMEMREHNRRMAKSAYDIRVGLDALGTTSVHGPAAGVQPVSSHNLLVSSTHSNNESSNASIANETAAQPVGKQCLVVSGGQVQTTDAHDPPIEQSLQTDAFPHEAQVVSIEIPDTNGESDTMAIESSVSQASQQGLPMHDRLVPKEDGPPPYSEAYTSVQIGISAKPQPEQLTIPLPQSQQMAKKQRSVDLPHHHSFGSSDKGPASSSYGGSLVGQSLCSDQTLSDACKKDQASLKLQRGNKQDTQSTPARDAVANSISAPLRNPAAEGATAIIPSSFHRAIPTIAHSLGSGNSCDDGTAVTVEYFPSCFMPEEDAVFPESCAKADTDHSSDVHNGGQEKAEILPPNYLSAADIQRSQSLNRGHKGILLNAEWLKPATVSARGPQTRSVYDLRGEDSSFIFSELSETDLQKPCGHNCMMGDKGFCCLCKKNSSWTFCDSGSATSNGPVAMWSKGCHLCRRRATDQNQLSTVSRPRAVRNSDGSLEGPIISANKDAVPNTATPSVHPLSVKPKSPTTTRTTTSRKCAIM